MSDIVIRAENISKKYVLGATSHSNAGFRHVLSDIAAAPLRKLKQLGGSREQNGKGSNRTAGQDFWALKDVSFDVRLGEVIGIIGRNGAGKSTLLKILSRITDPTKGRVGIKGRVASLLEVGTGFHQELSGRENIFLNGAILGMTRAEIRKKFDEIVEFADVGEFLDTPVKRYSSGMYVRLAFSVAAHLEPEILIVDEVLAVGDASFQKKCLGKMDEVSKKDGRAVLFVSHNMHAVSTLTKQCFLIRKGELVMKDSPQRVIAAYLEDGMVGDDIYLAPGPSYSPAVTRVELQTSEPSNTQVNGQPMRFIFNLQIPQRLKSGTFSFQVIDSMGQPAVHLWLIDSNRSLFCEPGNYRLVCEVPNLRLYMGRYSITTYLSEQEGGTHFQTIEGICPFEVVMFGNNREWKWKKDACRYIEDGNWSVEEQ